MLISWRRSPFFVQMPCFDTVDDGGGGGGGEEGSAHPEYDVDFEQDDAGGGNDDPSRQPGARTGQPPVRDPARQPAGAPGQDGGTPQTYTPEQYNQVANGYRTLQTQNQQLAGQLQVMQRQIQALTGTAPSAPAGGVDMSQFSEADQKAIKAVNRLFPGLADILAKKDALLKLPDLVDGFQSEQTATQQATATRTWDTFDAEVKKAYGGKDVHPFAKQAIDSAFVNWLETDKNAAARYRMGDLSLPAEFVRMYVQGVINPARALPSPQNNGQPRRPGQQQQQPRVPRGGTAGAPHVPGQRPAQPGKAAAEVHEAAADAYFARG